MIGNIKMNDNIPNCTRTTQRHTREFNMVAIKGCNKWEDVIDQQAQIHQQIQGTTQPSTNTAQRPLHRIIKPQYLRDFV